MEQLSVHRQFNLVTDFATRRVIDDPVDRKESEHLVGEKQRQRRRQAKCAGNPLKSDLQKQRKLISCAHVSADSPNGAMKGICLHSRRI